MLSKKTSCDKMNFCHVWEDDKKNKIYVSVGVRARKDQGPYLCNMRIIPIIAVKPPPLHQNWKSIYFML